MHACLRNDVCTLASGPATSKLVIAGGDDVAGLCRRPLLPPLPLPQASNAASRRCSGPMACCRCAPCWCCCCGGCCCSRRDEGSSAPWLGRGDIPGLAPAPLQETRPAESVNQGFNRGADRAGHAKSADKEGPRCSVAWRPAKNGWARGLGAGRGGWGLRNSCGQDRAGGGAWSVGCACRMG